MRYLFWLLFLLIVPFGLAEAQDRDIGGGLAVDSSGNLKVNVAAGGAGDGAILDGVTSSIKATVKDYANSNPLTVVVVDTNGDAASIGGGTQYNQGGAAGATDTMTMAGGVRSDTAAVDAGVADGDRVRCIVDSTGKLWVNVGTVAVTVASLPLPSGASTSTLQGGGLPAALGAGGGLKIDGSGTALPTSLATLPALTAGTAEVGKLAAGSALIGKVGTDQTTHGTTDKVAADVYVGGAVASQTNPVPTVFPGTLVSGAITTAMTATTSTSLVGATASNYLYITSCSLSNDHASVTTTILLQDGSGGTTLWKGIVPFGGGSNVPFPVPLKVPTAGNALYAANVTTGSSTYASCSGFRSTVSY